MKFLLLNRIPHLYFLVVMLGLALMSANPAQSLDSMIAFSLDREGRLDIFVMKSDGSRQRNLTQNPASVHIDPAWSPDGRKIAFEKDRDIYIMNPNGENSVNLTKGPTDDKDPAWSPDGRQIAFYSDRNLKPGICLMDAADGANFKRISFRGEHYPSWSPTGTHIAFWLLVGEGKIGVMKANGQGAANSISWRAAILAV